MVSYSNFETLFVSNNLLYRVTCNSSCLNFTEGDIVNAGDVLATIDNQQSVISEKSSAELLNISQSNTSNNAPALKQSEANLRLAAEKLKQDETRKFFLDEVERREKAINELLSQRASRIQTLNEFQKAGLLSEFATLQKSGEVVNELQPKIKN